MIRIIEYKTAGSSEIDHPIHRSIADRPLIGDKLHPDDVRDIEAVAQGLRPFYGPVFWVWFRWSR